MPKPREIKIEEDFYPRPPRGGRPHELIRDAGAVLISIHVLREEDDGRH